MKLYIQVENGLPINHPAFEDNLIAAFGVVPDNWEPFVRIPRPDLSDYKVLLNETPSYQKVDGVWADVWDVRDMTPEERSAFDAQKQADEREAKIAAAHHYQINRPYASNFSAWVFNENTLLYEPPIPRPQDGKFYRWSGPDNNWKEAEPFPQDGKRYYFDFDNWVNVEITNV